MSKLKYGEFSFPAPKARPTVGGYARGGKAETKGQAKISKESVKSAKLVGMKREPEAIVKKEIALLKKAGAPAKIIKHEEREMTLPSGMKKGGKTGYANGGEVNKMVKENVRAKEATPGKRGAGQMTDRERRMMEQARGEKMDRQMRDAERQHYERERSENEADRKAAQDALMYIPRKIGEGARSAYDYVMGKKKGGAVHEDVAMDKKIVKKAVHKHEAAMHPGKPMTKLKKGGKPEGYFVGGRTPMRPPARPATPPLTSMATAKPAVTPAPAKPVTPAPAPVKPVTPAPAPVKPVTPPPAPAKPVTPPAPVKKIANTSGLGFKKGGVPVHKRTSKC